MRISRTLLVGVVLLSTGCVDRNEATTDSPQAHPAADSPDMLRPPVQEGSPGDSAALAPSDPTEDRGAEAASTGASERRRSTLRVVFLGTSLTEGLGLDQPATEAWPSRIGAMYEAAGMSVEVVNAGVSGETSAGALRRLEWILQQDPGLLVLETGANDGLRGLPIDQLEANLDSLVRRTRELRPGLPLVIVPMEAPPNMGADYATSFREVFSRVADRHDVPVTPFLLEDVAGNAALNQSDGIHPTAEGHRIMARTAWPVLDSVTASLVAP